MDEFPKLVRPDDPNNVSQEDLRIYIERIRLGKEKWKEEFTHQASKGHDEVSEADFINWFEHSENSGWLNTSGLRENLKKIGIAVKRAQKKRDSERHEHHDS